jgi:hypothetical protein
MVYAIRNTENACLLFARVHKCWGKIEGCKFDGNMRENLLNVLFGLQGILELNINARIF